MPADDPLAWLREELGLDDPVRELHKRAAAFPTSTIVQNPNTIAQLVTSLVPTEKLATIGRAMVFGSNYVAQRDSFAGIPGALSNIRARALAITDPAIRARALEIVTWFQSHSPDVQQMLWAGDRAQLEARLPGDEQVLAFLFPEREPMDTGGLVDLSSPGSIAGVVGKAFAAPFIGAGWVISKGVDALQAGVEAVPGGTVASQGLEALQRGVGFAVREGFEPGFQYAINSVQYVTALPWEVSNAVLGIGSKPGESFLDQLERYAPKWKATEHGPWVRTAADLAGISMDDPAYEGWFDLLDLAGYLLVGEGIFRGAAAIKKARATPLEVGAVSGRGVLGRAFVRAQQRGVEEFIHASPGRAVLAEIERTHTRYPGEQFKGALVERFKDIAPDLAEALSQETNIAGWSRVFARHVEDIPSASRVGTVAAELRRINDNIKALAGGERGVADLDVLRARALNLQGTLNDLIFKWPQFEWPKASLMRAVLHDAPVTRLEGLLGAIFGYHPERNLLVRGLNVQRFVNDLPRFARVHMPRRIAADSPVDWAIRNATVVTRVLRVTKTPTATIRLILGKMTDITTRGDFYEWMNSIADAIELGVTRGGKRPVDPLLLEQITTFFRNPELERIRSPIHDQVTMPDGTTRLVQRNVLERQVGPDAPVAVPSQPNEFIAGFRIPDIELMRDATSTLHRMDTFLRTRRVGNLRVGKWAMTPLDVARSVLNLSTMVGKPSVLVPRFPAMTMRIQLEEAFRNIGFGFKPFAILDRLRARGWDWLPGGTPVRQIPLKKALPREGAPALGLILDEAADFSTRYQHPIYTAEWRTGIRDLNLDAAVAEELAAGLFQGLRHLHEDWLVREIVKRGPEKTLAWLEADATTRHGYWYANDMRPHLAELGTDPLTWLKDKMRQVDEATGGNPLLKEGIITGKWYRPGQLGALDVLSGRAGEGFRSEVYTRLQAELSDVTEAWYAARRPGGSEVVRAELQARRADIVDHLASLETEAPSRMYISLDNKYAMTGEILNAIRAGEFQLPATVFVERAGVRRPAALTGIRAVNDIAARMSNQLYRAFTLLNKVEVAGTRGSLFFQQINRIYDGLIEAGWKKSRAFETAQYRAAFLTRDMMYDLAARSSVHRSLKDVFWFLPAVQEILTTWLIKIPSRGYWPLGFGYLVNRVDIVFDLFKEAGIIKTATNTMGEEQDYVAIPGMSAFMEKLRGRKVPDITFFKPTGLNLVLTGLPGLSPPAGFVVGQAARERGGIFKTISDWFQPFGPEVAWMPAVANYVYETVMGDPPPLELFSQAYQQQIFDRAWDQGLQYAYSDLIAEQNTPPRIESYADRTDPLTGNASLSAEAEARYLADQKAWFRDWARAGDDYFRGVAWVRGLGASVTPAALYTTSEERQEWIDFWQGQVVPAGYAPPIGPVGPETEGRPPSDLYVPLREAQKDMITEFLSEHPGSLAFATGYTVLGDKQRDLPYRSTGDDAVFDKLYTGELRVLAGKPDISHQEYASEYMRRVAEIESWRYYVGQLNSCLQDYGTTAQSQLRNAYKVQQCVADYHFGWDRYLALNPDMEADIRKNRRRWADSYGIPVRTFEVEREAQLLQLMRQATPFFIGAGGLRSGDWRSVVAQVGELYSKEGTFGTPNTKIEKEKAAYFKQVMKPHWNTVGGLFDEATALQASGQYAGDVYDRIRQITETYKLPPEFKGFPTPERYSWGNLTEGERRNAVVAWSTRPQTWLTSFQMKQVGYPVFEGRDDLLATIRTIETQYHDALVQRDVAPSSNEADALKALRLRVLNQAARPYGDQGARLVRLYDGPPIARLVEFDYGAGNEHWQDMVQGVAAATQRILAEELSPASYSQLAVALKTHIEGVIEILRDPNDPNYDREFDRLWTRLGRAVPLKGFDYREGVLLYEAILFDQFNESAFGLAELVRAVEA